MVDIQRKYVKTNIDKTVFCGGRGRVVEVLGFQSLTLTAWVRVPVGTKTFMWGGLPADKRCVGGSTHTCEYFDIRLCGVSLHQ